MNATPLPADPEFGAVISHHPSDRLRPLIVAAIIGAPVMVGLNFTLARSDAWYGRPLTVIVVAALGLALGWYILHVWNREIVLYELGLSYREGSETVFFFYDEIRSIRLSAERRAYFGGLWRRNVYHFTITTTRDEQFIITNRYRGASDLGAVLEARAIAALRPIIQARLAAGEWVAFTDELRVSATGLRVASLGQLPRELAWAEVSGFGRGNRQLIIHDAAHADWVRLPLAEIDNLMLLMETLWAHLKSDDHAHDDRAHDDHAL
ncbi:MAG: DUF6585 family protein [Chloroflexota bacterium]|nr:DUF6585 family protein [Chloroflexota bacterium]